MSSRIQAPRGTYDVLGEAALARDALEAHARRILQAAGYRRIETPVFDESVAANSARESVLVLE